MDKLKEIVDLIEQANKICNSTADWEIKYDLIFDLGIWQKIREAGFSFGYYVQILHMKRMFELICRL